MQNMEMDAAYVVVPYDLRREFGKGRLKVNATFNDEGNICYILGVTKAVRKQIGKTFGDEIEVTFTPV